MNKHNRVAAIHDLSGFGRCSLTVIIPTLSSMGIQVCPVPTAILSTHTGGFDDMVFKDLTDFIIPCYRHYKELGIEFDAVYSGFLASQAQIDCCLEFFGGYKNALKIIDPVMGDYGKPYKTYSKKMCDRMRELVSVADVITPNLTEAAILLGEEYTHELSQEKAVDWLIRLCEYAPTVIITGVHMAGGGVCNVGYDGKKGEYWRVDYDYIPAQYPGTGDIFASVLTGRLLLGDTLQAAMDKATVFAQMTVKQTYGNGELPRNGVALESLLPWLSSGS